MDSLSAVLKRKRDQEERLRRSDPTKNIVIGEDGAGGQTAHNPADALTVAVESINDLIGEVDLVAGDNITITPSGQTLIIAATGGGGGSGAFDWGSITVAAGAAQDWGSLA